MTHESSLLDSSTMTTMENKTYSDLIAKFPTSEALLAYLRSAEGGRLIVRDDMMTPDDPLIVIRYEKGVTDMTLPHVESFRSVVWNMRTNRPVCASPTRGLKFGAAVDAAVTDFLVEEFVDGVMVNLFWDESKQVWRIATRTHLDAACNYYGRRTFAQLFWETLALTGVNPSSLSKNYTYSWVLQHPEERIVVAPAYGLPKLRLVEVARILEDGGHLVMRTPKELLPVAVHAMLPETHELATLEDVKERVEAWGKRFGTQWQGLVIKNKELGASPRRWKLRSNEYDEARHLRGNQPKLQFTWLERWSANKLKQYTALYPEEANAANATVERFKACTQEVHDLYTKIYKLRAFPLGQAPQKYRKLLWEIHAAKKGSYFPELRTFMNGQDTARKLWLVNYEARYPAPTVVPEVATAPAPAPAPAPTPEVATPAVEVVA